MYGGTLLCIGVGTGGPSRSASDMPAAVAEMSPAFFPTSSGRPRDFRAKQLSANSLLGAPPGATVAVRPKLETNLHSRTAVKQSTAVG